MINDIRARELRDSGIIISVYFVTDQSADNPSAASL